MHGGAGNLREGEGEYARIAEEGLRSALRAGEVVLAGGGSALDAAVAAVVVLEDCEVFNAGRGGVLNGDGELELDAAVMEGSGRRAGAVAGLRRHRPVEAARAVLEDGRHVLLAGEGADAFAAARGLAGIDPQAWTTPFRRDQWERARARGAGTGSASGGTVGAVARDARGRLAAATSTGGILGKRPGRVSDSALIGSGTWADDASCAVSATGEGEYFIRSAFAARVDAAVRAGAPIARACAEALAAVAALGGSGGCIAVGREGDVALPFDTPGMARGLVREGEPPRWALRSDPVL